MGESNHSLRGGCVIPCRLFYGSISPHLQQLYTGFLLLDGSGVIRLS
jgi:hypothetical protein